ncbi:MAG: hydrogenase nickel incorporation protein HypB [Pseudomonadota bacterium]
MEIRIVKKVLEANANVADEVRKRLRTQRRSMVNFMSAPGAGKTLLLEKLIPALRKRGLAIGVIEGDITTSNDSKRLKPLDLPIAQINTEFFGGDCHLTSAAVLTAYKKIEAQKFDIALIENVGNLVCPAEFDTGSDLNIVLLSVTEGEDKPLKYPLMFRTSHVALINKVDLAVAAETNLDLMRSNMLKVNPKLTVVGTSGKTGEGIKALAELLVKTHQRILGK